MAIDTRDRRMSMIGLDMPTPTVLPDPASGFANAPDRYHLLWLYRGIVSTASNVPAARIYAIASESRVFPIGV